MQSDPLGLSGGYNIFVYAEANAISIIDQLGLISNPREKLEEERERFSKCMDGWRKRSEFCKERIINKQGRCKGHCDLIPCVTGKVVNITYAGVVFTSICELAKVRCGRNCEREHNPSSCPGPSTWREECKPSPEQKYCYKVKFVDCRKDRSTTGWPCNDTVIEEVPCCDSK